MSGDATGEHSFRPVSDRQEASPPPLDVRPSRQTALSPTTNTITLVRACAAPNRRAYSRTPPERHPTCFGAKAARARGCTWPTISTRPSYQRFDPRGPTCFPRLPGEPEVAILTMRNSPRRGRTSGAAWRYIPSKSPAFRERSTPSDGSTTEEYRPFAGCRPRAPLTMAAVACTQHNIDASPSTRGPNRRCLAQGHRPPKRPMNPYVYKRSTPTAPTYSRTSRRPRPFAPKARESPQPNQGTDFATTPHLLFAKARPCSAPERR